MSNFVISVFIKSLELANYSQLWDLLKRPCSEDFDEQETSGQNCHCLEFLQDDPYPDTPFLRLLKCNCCLFYGNIEPVEITSLLFKERIINEDECERIQTAISRYARCIRLFSCLLKSTHSNTVPIFLKSLSSKFSFVVIHVASKLCDVCTHKNLSGVPTRSNDKLLFYQAKFHCVLCTSSEETSTGANEVAETCHIDEVTGKQVVSFVKNPGSIGRFALPCRKLVLAFNYLSCLVNQGHYDTFEVLSTQMEIAFSHNGDMRCLLSYLGANKFMFENKVDDAKFMIQRGLDIVPSTSNPKYFMVELFNAKSRMYITTKKLTKLESILADIKQIVEIDPAGCQGRATGWLYINDSRCHTTQMSLINLSQPKGIKRYHDHFVKAKQSLLKALDNFKEDASEDSNLGTAYAICRISTLLLRCGENGLTMDILRPRDEDVQTADTYLKRLEDCDIPMTRILEIQFLLAKCDCYFRQGNNVRAIEKVMSAHSIAEEVQHSKFKGYAQNRIQFLYQGSQFEICTGSQHDAVMKELLSDSSSQEDKEDTD